MVRSDSHTLSPAPFRLLQEPNSNIRVRQIEKRRFVLSVRALNETAPEREQMHHCHHVICGVLIALNAGTLGGFYWFDDPWVHPQLTVADDFEGTNAHGSVLIVESDTAAEDLKELSELDIYNTVLIFGIVAKEKTRVLTDEYCRGLLLLRMNFYDLNFRREAFLCFYRALEHFVASRILGVKRLSNELKQLRQGLATLTKSSDMLDELKTIYAVRSSQVAHSQSLQRELTVEEVLKTKVFLDFVMHKTFKKQANEVFAAKAAKLDPGRA